MSEDKIVKVSEWKDKNVLADLLEDNILRIGCYEKMEIVEPYSARIRYVLKHEIMFPQSTAETTHKI